MKTLIILLILLCWIIMSAVVSFVWALTFGRIYVDISITITSFFLWPIMLIICLVYIIGFVITLLVERLVDLCHK